MSYELLGQQSQRQADVKAEVVLATVPQRHDDTVLEIVMIHGADGVTNVELRSLVWGNGLGWYRQHTLQLDGIAAADTWIWNLLSVSSAMRLAMYSGLP